MTHHTPDRAPEYKEYLAWDGPTRWFHWINALAVLGLIGTGLGVLNDMRWDYPLAAKFR